MVSLLYKYSASLTNFWALLSVIEKPNLYYNSWEKGLISTVALASQSKWDTCKWKWRWVQNVLSKICRCEVRLSWTKVIDFY